MRIYNVRNFHSKRKISFKQPFHRMKSQLRSFYKDIKNNQISRVSLCDLVMNIWIIIKLVPYGRVVDGWSWDQSGISFFESSQRSKELLLYINRCLPIRRILSRTHRYISFWFFRTFTFDNINFETWRSLFSLPHPTDILVLHNFA